MASDNHSKEHMEKIGMSTQFKKGDPKTIELAKIANKKSTEKKREIREFREYLTEALSVNKTNPKTGESGPVKKFIMMNLVNKSLQGDLGAIRMIMDITGETPATEVNTNLNITGRFNNTTQEEREALLLKVERALRKNDGKEAKKSNV